MESIKFIFLKKNNLGEVAKNITNHLQIMAFQKNQTFKEIKELDAWGSTMISLDKGLRVRAIKIIPLVF